MIEFWFDFASVYAHLTAQRIEEKAQDHDMQIAWRPFLLGPIFAAQGCTSSPFNLYPHKGRNAWRDAQRLSARANLPLKRPDPFPANSMLAMRIALQGQDAPWIGAFTRQVFKAEFCEGKNIADTDVMREILTTLNLPASQMLEAARSDAVKNRLKMQTDEAQRRGIYGAPSFIVDGELFWGNDRLDDALEWAERPWA